MALVFLFAVVFAASAAVGGAVLSLWLRRVCSEAIYHEPQPAARRSGSRDEGG